MDNTEFPKAFPDVGGMNFESVAENPKYKVFCEFVQNRMENCSGLFLEFQIYLNKRHDDLQVTGHNSGNGVSNGKSNDVQ